MLVVGIGARRGVAADAVTEALRRLAAEHGIDLHDVRGYASVESKAAEPGILAAIAPAPLRVFPAAVLATVGVPHPSPRVRDATGSPSVAEAAALHAAAVLAGGADVRLVVGKTVVGGVTVAVARIELGRDAQGLARRGL